MTDGARSAIEILREYRQLELRREELRDRIARLIEGGTRATASFSATGVGGGSGAFSRVENAAIKIADLTVQIEREIQRLSARCWMIQDAINGIQNERYKRLLELRYIDGLRWRDVNARLYISRQHSTKLHAAALDAFYISYINIESQ